MRIAKKRLEKRPGMFEPTLLEYISSPNFYKLPEGGYIMFVHPSQYHDLKGPQETVCKK